MNNIEIVFDVQIGLYGVYVDGEIKYECLAKDEVLEVVEQELD